MDNRRYMEMKIMLNGREANAIDSEDDESEYFDEHHNSMLYVAIADGNTDLLRKLLVKWNYTEVDMLGSCLTYGKIECYKLIKEVAPQQYMIDALPHVVYNDLVKSCNIDMAKVSLDDTVQYSTIADKIANKRTYTMLYKQLIEMCEDITIDTHVIQSQKVKTEYANRISRKIVALLVKTLNKIVSLLV